MTPFRRRLHTSRRSRGVYFFSSTFGGSGGGGGGGGFGVGVDGPITAERYQPSVLSGTSGTWAPGLPLPFLPMVTRETPMSSWFALRMAAASALAARGKKVAAAAPVWVGRWRVMWYREEVRTR